LRSPLVTSAPVLFLQRWPLLRFFPLQRIAVSLRPSAAASQADHPASAIRAAACHPQPRAVRPCGFSFTPLLTCRRQILAATFSPRGVIRQPILLAGRSRPLSGATKPRPFSSIVSLQCYWQRDVRRDRTTLLGFDSFHFRAFGSRQSNRRASGEASLLGRAPGNLDTPADQTRCRWWSLPDSHRAIFIRRNSDIGLPFPGDLDRPPIRS